MKEMKLRVQNLILLLFLSTCVLAQNVGINTDGSTPNASAILDIKSTAMGLLIPRMTSAQRTAIASPAKGLLVFDTDTNNFWFYGNTQWISLSTGWALGGNTGTDPANQFLGTADNKPLTIKVNNTLAGQINIAGDLSTSWGYRALLNNTALYNTAIGAEALKSNTTGSSNTAVGAQSFTNNTTGSGNTGLGHASMVSNTTGSYNTGIGYEALNTNSTGTYNTAVGGAALANNTTGTYNTGVGVQALFENTTGNNNTAIGVIALENNTTGTENTAIGLGALEYNTIGSQNTGTGSYALYSNTTGNFNVGYGYLTLYNNTTGEVNSAFGVNALYYNTIGVGNTAIGAEALYYNNTGNTNTAVGRRALIHNGGGSSNTGLGYGTDVAFNNLTNATTIGYNAVVNASNKVRIGNAAVTVIEGQVPFTSPSDGRFKFNVREDVKGLDFILQLRPVTYQFDTKRFDASLISKSNGQKNSGDDLMQASYDKASAIRRTGFIAQEVERAANKVNYDFSGLVKPATADDHYSLSYESFVVPLVKAVQELSAQVENLKAEIKQLKTPGKQ